MARNTNRNNIKPMLTGISLMVMILFCLFATRAFINMGWLHFTQGDRVAYSAAGLTFLAVFNIISFATLFVFFRFQVFLAGSFLRGLTFFTLPKSFTFLSFAIFSHICKLIFLRLISFAVCFATILTMIPKTIPRVLILVKFRKVLDYFAFRASFCYGLIRHGFFLHEKLCLEPLQAQYLCGSLYYTTNEKGGK